MSQVSEPQNCIVSNQSMYLIVDNGFKLKRSNVFIFLKKYEICHDHPLSLTLGSCKCCSSTALCFINLRKLNVLSNVKMVLFMNSKLFTVL